MKKVIYSGCTEKFWIHVAAQLFVECDWKPIYWIAYPPIKSLIKSKFPSVIFHSNLDAVRGIRAHQYSDVLLRPLDVEILENNRSTQLTALKMMDRIDALGSFDYHERVRLFNFQLSYWQTVLDDLQPEIVVFSVIPHMVFDYILYKLCKQCGIRTVMFESTPMQGLTFVMESFDETSQTEKLYKKFIEDPPEDIAEVPLQRETLRYLEAIMGDYEEIPDYMRRGYKEELPIVGESSEESFIQKIFNFERYSRYFSKQKQIIINRFTPPLNYLKQKGKKLENSQMSRWEYTLFRVKAARKMRHLERYYHQLARNVDLDIPYIYVALGFQPERTTSPMGSIFVNQYLMIDLLAKSLPDDWFLYVKEHPTQFTKSQFFRAQSGRTKELYDDILALPNVSLVPMDTDSFDLIDHAKAVATVTGTVGWEAILRGKPALIFGYPWYRGCEGTFQIHTHHNCINVIEKISDGYEIDSVKLSLFIYALEQTGINASVEPHLKVADIDDRENAERIVRSISRILS